MFDATLSGCLIPFEVQELFRPLNQRASSLEGFNLKGEVCPRHGQGDQITFLLEFQTQAKPFLSPCTAGTLLNRAPCAYPIFPPHFPVLKTLLKIVSTYRILYRPFTALT